MLKTTECCCGNVLVDHPKVFYSDLESYYFPYSADWLVDRRHCDVQWQSHVIEIRQKINSAIQDMPEHPDITQLLAGSCKSSFLVN